MRRLSALLVLAALAAAAAGCGGSTSSVAVPGGDASRGEQAIETYGCGACHTIAGVPGANAVVGPDLHDFGDRRAIAGALPNTVDDLVRWLMSPQAVEPGTVMPDMGVTERDARDIAAYLYSH